MAASGYAVERDGVFVYDRIATEGVYRRYGLGPAVMAALGKERRLARFRPVLVASPAGRALYAALGWRVLSPYSTAEIAAQAACA